MGIWEAQTSRGESWEDCEWRLRIGHCCQPFSDIQPGALLPGGRKLLLFPFHRGRGRGPEQVWDLPEVTQYKAAESEIGLGSLEALQVLDAKSSSLSHSPMVSDSPAGWGRPEGRQAAPIWVVGEGEERGLVSSSGSGVLHTTEGIKIKAQIRIKLRLWPELPSFLGPGWNKDIPTREAEKIQVLGLEPVGTTQFNVACGWTQCHHSAGSLWATCAPLGLPPSPARSMNSMSFREIPLSYSTV